MPQNNLGLSLGKALGQFAFGADDPKASMKGMLDGTHAGAYDASARNSLASALKAEAEAADLRAAQEMRNPANLLRNAMTGYGVPLEEVGAVENFMKSGRLGGKYEPAVDGYGPSMPQPEWISKLPEIGRNLQGVQTALTIGDKNSENIAKAGAISREGRLGDDVIAGRLDPLKLAQAQYASKGSAPFKFEEFGVGNNLTGTLDESTGAARNFAGKRQAETAAQKANAAQSYASAGNSNASAAKTRQEIEQGGKSGQTQIVTDANGNVTLVNKVTGQAKPAIYADGSTVGAKAGTTKPLTEGQAKAVAFASRMENSNAIIENLGESNVFTSVPGSRGFAGPVINAIQPEKRQQLDQAKRDFINAVLRRESGAVISKEEFDNAEKQYFPQIGEGKTTRENKALNRRIALEGMKVDIPSSLGDMSKTVVDRAKQGKPDSLTPQEQAELAQLRSRFKK